MLTRQAPEAGQGVAQATQVDALGLNVFQVCLGGGVRAIKPHLEIPLTLGGLLQDLSPVVGGSLGPDERLAHLPPAVETRRDLLQPLLRSIGVAGVLLCFFRRLCRESPEGSGLAIQGIHYLVELAVLELAAAGGTVFLGAALDGLPRPVHILRLALVSGGRTPPGRRQLAQLLLLPTQLALPCLQVLAGRKGLQLLREPLASLPHCVLAAPVLGVRRLDLSELAQPLLGSSQLLLCLLQHRHRLREKLCTIQAEEVVPAWQWATRTVELLQCIRYLGFDVRHALLGGAQLLTVPVALLDALPVLLQALQLCLELRQPVNLRLELLHLLLGR